MPQLLILLVILLLVGGGILLARARKNIFIPIIILVGVILAGGIAYMLGGLFGNQGTLFRVEIAEIFSPAKDETQKALEFSLPLDPEVLEQFEAELFQVPGDLLAYRLQWQEDWYEYELIPQPEGLSEAVEQNLFRDPVIRIYEGDGRRAFLRYREGGFEVESSEGSKEMVAIRHYDIVINQQGDLSDPEGVLEEYKKDIETLLATHFDREYRKQHPW